MAAENQGIWGRDREAAARPDSLRPGPEAAEGAAPDSDKGWSRLRRVRVLDTTLRAGEQAPGVCLGLAQKLAIARQLARLGVDAIEVGFPAASPGEAAAVATVARQVQGLTLRAMARCREADIDVAYRCLLAGARVEIGLFLATSSLHLEQKLHLGPEQALSLIAESVYYARRLGMAVNFTAEDAARSDRDFLVTALGAAVAAGASSVTLADSVGYATPAECAALVESVRQRLPAVPVAVCCHNDLGMAVAGTLAAVAAGASGVEVTVCGLGERAGNAALEPVVMALRCRPDAYGATSGVDVTQLLPTAQLVARLTGQAVPPNQPVTGANAFQHQSGVAQDGVLKDQRTYLLLDPAELGASSGLCLGKHSGRHAFALYLSTLGHALSGPSLEIAFTRFKDACDQGRLVSDDELLEMARGAASTWLKAPET